MSHPVSHPTDGSAEEEQDEDEAPKKRKSANGSSKVS